MTKRISCIVAISLLAASSIGASQARFKPSDWNDDYEAAADKLIKNPPRLSANRLPKGFKVGRCLLVVYGKTRISGPCSYSIEANGNFHINGPHQVFDGIDYPKAEITAAEISTDYWANVFRDEDGFWTGYGNDNIGSVHGSGSWGHFHRSGACHLNDRVKVCVWTG